MIQDNYKHIIYKVVCKVNNKIYIGRTSTSLHLRKKGHVSCTNRHKKCSHFFHSAIRKYGIENFEWVILENNIDSNDIAELEKYYIKKYNSYKKGYNLTEGGEGTLGYYPSDITRKKMSEKRKGILNPNYGKHHSEEAKRKIAISNNWKGKNHKKESCEKVAISKGGKKFIIIKDNIVLEEFVSIRECGRKYNLDNSSIAKCLKNKPLYKTVKQYKFKYI